MDLNSDLISLQGPLITLQKSIGEFRKITDKAGNEDKVAKIVTELENILGSQNYLKNGIPNEVFKTEISNFVLFLIINTELPTPLKLEGHSHLANIIPQFSRCLLANVVMELGLIEHYCQCLQDYFPLSTLKPLLVEFLPCLKKCNMSKRLENAGRILDLLILRISQSDGTQNKIPEVVGRLIDLGSEILSELTVLYGEFQNDYVYESMGRTLCKLFDLLLKCDLKNFLLVRLIERMISTCQDIIIAVSIEVYCAWAEVQYEDQVLQMVVGERAYLFVEKYQKFAPAKELIQKLASIARKPRTLSDLIRQANVPTIISMIDKADANQKSWFKALLNNQALENEETIVCIQRWAHLCTEEDVLHLFGLISSSSDQGATNLAIKCAATLPLESLTKVSLRHFHRYGYFHLCEDNQQQLIILFNKLKDASKIDEDFCKELHLLILQNPEQTFSFVFGECLKNEFYTLSLKEIFPTFKEHAAVQSLGLNTLNKEIGNNPPNDQNCNNYKRLLNALIEGEFLSLKSVICEIFVPLIEKSYRESSNDVLKMDMEILKGIPVCFSEDSSPLFELLFEIMKSYRCKFLDFDRVKQEIVKDVVEIIEKCCIYNTCDNKMKTEENDDDAYVTFYRIKLFQNNCPDLLQYFNPELDYENHAKIVTHLVKILPISTKQEWISIVSTLCNHCGSKKSIEFLTDFLVLLCHLVKSQETETEQVKSMLNALKYYLQLFGIVLKECLYPRIRNLEEDVTISKNICRLLKDIPSKQMKCEEGLSLAHLLSEESLKSLKTDKTFAYSIVSINESLICQMLAKKMLN